MPQPPVILQSFHWYLRPEDRLWERIRTQAPDLAAAGFTHLWLPPACKGAAGRNDVGYGPYDLFDLGEFDQKGTVATKYGTKAAYVAAVRAAHEQGLRVLADTVFNHKNGADATEVVTATPVDRSDRSRREAPIEIEAHTRFTFPGRRGAYSPMEWNWTHFDAVDTDARRPEEAGQRIFLLKDKAFDPGVDKEHGNYDFLMFADLDMENPEVRDELKRWGVWFLQETGVDGFRLDGVKHIHAPFLAEWLDHVRAASKKDDLFAVGEYWKSDAGALAGFLERTGDRLHVLDVPLHFRFHEASHGGGHFDMRKLLTGTLLERRPDRAVTFVDNHDTQPRQALASFVSPWFKPLAYAVILLRAEGLPCVFSLDYEGGTYTDGGKADGEARVEIPAHKEILDTLLAIRRDVAHGPQQDYFDDPNVVGWTRTGDDDHPRAMAVLLTDADGGEKWMDVARPGATFRDRTGQVDGTLEANDDGWAPFRVNGGSVSVWVEEA